MKIKKAIIEDLDIASNLFDLYRQFYKQNSDLTAAKEFISERINKNESEIFLAIDEDYEITFTKDVLPGMDVFPPNIDPEELIEIFDRAL